MAKTSFYNEFVTALRAGYTYDLQANLPDPDPILKKLGVDVAVYQDIRTDAKVAACIEQRKAGVLSLQWDLTAAEQKEDAAVAAGLEVESSSEQPLNVIKGALKALDMPRIITEILDAFLWGFQPLEIMWEHRDGFILPKDVIGKPSEWFLFDYQHRLKFRSITAPLGEELPARKFLLAQHHPSYKNPFGQKVLPLCFWPVTFKRSGWKWWVTFAEKWGTPFLLGKFPRGLPENDQNKFLEMLELLFQDAVSIAPNDCEINTLGSGGGESGNVHKALIDQCNSEIALAIVGQTLTSEVGANGSYAAAKTHNDVRAEIVAYDKRMVELAMQTLVNWIYELNYSSGQPPIFALWAEDDVDQLQAERDKVLTDTGLKFTKSYYRRVYGLLDDDFEISAQGQAPGPAEFAEAPSKLSGKVLNTRPSDVQTAYLGDQKLTDIGQAVLRSALSIIDKSSTLEEVLGQLSELFPKTALGELQDCATLAFALSRAEGRSNG